MCVCVVYPVISLGHELGTHIVPLVRREVWRTSPASPTAILNVAIIISSSRYILREQLLARQTDRHSDRHTFPSGRAD